MLDFQLVQAPFRFGVEEGIDPKQVPFGTLLVAENVVWKKSGRIEKRNGVSFLGGLSGIKRLIVRGDELAATDGANIHTFTSAGWIDRGRHPELGLTWKTTQDSALGVKSADVARLSDGRLVYAWVSGDPTDTLNGGDVFFQVTEQSTGAVLSSPQRISATGIDATRVRIVTNGTNYAIIWTYNGNLFSYVNGTTTTLKTDVANATLRQASFDACTIGTEFVVAYALGAGGIRLVRYTFASTPVEQATNTVPGASSIAIPAISIDGAAGETLYIGYIETVGNKVRRAMANPSTLAQTVAPGDIDAPGSSPVSATIAVHRVSSTAALYTWSFEAPSIGSVIDGEVGLLRSMLVSSSGPVFNKNTTAFARLLSRPFTINGRQYVFAGNHTNTATLTSGNPIEGSDVYVLDVTATDVSPESPHRLVGKVESLVGGAWFHGHVANVAVLSASQYLAVTPLLSEAASNLTGWRQGLRSVTVSFGESLPRDMWRGVQIGPETYLAASVLTAYDGRDPLPSGFAHSAYLDWGNTTVSSAGGTMVDGVYLYNVVPERRSAVGVLHRGPTAVTQRATITGPTTAGSVTLRVVPVHPSLSPQFELLAIYRSAKGAEPLQRLTIEPSFAVLENQALVAPLTLTDTAGDANVGGTGILNIAERPAMYTEGGELDDFQPPALLTLCTYRGRLFGIDGSRRTVRYSKSHAANPGVAPGFNSAFRINIEDDLTALAVLDDRLIVFSQTGIYHLTGEGPAPNGDGPYESPNKIQTDVGCTNARAVVSGPDGVFFVSGNEIHMLDRGLNVQWVGKPVQDLLDAYPNVTSAVVVSSKNHIRFSCNNAAGTQGLVLVFDYIEKQWSSFRYNGDAPIADACMYAGAYTFVTTDGDLYREDDTTYLDDGAWVTALIVTAWMHAAGPLAYHSVRNFRIDGVSATPHGLGILVGFDGNLSFQQGPRIWSEGVSGVTAPGNSVTANVSIGTRRKCRSIRFAVTDFAPETYGMSDGAGPKWSSMGIEVGVKRGLGRLAARQKG